MHPLLIALAWTSTGCGTDSLVPDLENAIHAQGPGATVRMITAGEAILGTEVTGCIRTGDPAWLRMAQALQPGTNGATAESLGAAVSQALLKNPEGVLGMIGTQFTLDRVCSIPVVELSKRVAASYAREALTALDWVTDPHFALLKHECRGRFEAAQP